MIRAVVVEDEPLARCYLADLLTRTGRVEVVAQAEDARDGLRMCQQPGVEAAFLDIRLPGPDGLTLGKALAHLPHPPLLVFVTGFADYAVAAFQVHAADYLLKPIEAKRVEEAKEEIQATIQAGFQTLRGEVGKTLKDHTERIDELEKEAGIPHPHKH